jgi:hypothetical protein
MMSGVSLLLQHLADVRGGRCRRCENKTTPTPTLRCWMSSLLTVNSCIKVHLDLQADMSPVVVKGPFFPRVVNPRYRIRGTNV